MKKRLSMLLVIVIALMMAAPAAAFATAPPPAGTTGGTLAVEYRFEDGEEPEIPTEITRFGFRYFLVGQAEPVLESTLPNTRTYTYRIDGMLTPEQVNNIQGLGNVTLTPVYLISEREIDREVLLTGLPSNDIESIPMTRVFDDVNVGSTTGRDTIGSAELELTGVTFTEITSAESVPGPGTLSLPMEYSAIVVYRGAETFSIHGYYFADMTYVSEEGEDVDVFVVVAEYVTEDMPPPIDIEPGVPPGGEETATTLTESDVGLIEQQSGNPIVDIVNGLVPAGNFSETTAWSFLSLLLCVTAVYFAVINFIGFIAKRRQVSAYENIGVHDEEKLSMLKKRGNLLRLMTIFLGAMTVIMWLYLDNFSFGMVWINAFTPIIGILCAFTLVLRALTNYSIKKAMLDTESDSLATDTVA